MEISIELFNGVVTTTSNEIASMFGKQHREVLSSIATLIKRNANSEHGGNFHDAFQEEVYMAGNSREFRRYRVTRDGFALLAMGYTGIRAHDFKLKFISAFNSMERALAGRKSEAYRALERADLILDLERGDASKAGAALRRWQEIAPDLELQLLIAKQNVQMALPFEMEN